MLSPLGLNQVLNHYLLWLFVLLCLNGRQLLFASILCPQGYWPVSMNTTSQYGTENYFELKHMRDVEQPICRFCPGIGCYIIRHEVKPDEDHSMSDHGRSEQEFLERGTVASENGGSNDISDAENDTISKKPVDVKYSMSCSPNNQLPDPADIVTYLDCVMIGEKNRYYLFIYKPRFTVTPIPVVDCVDADFIAWIKDGVELMGLELGFPMKTIPPFLFLYHQRIMEATEYICIDGSALRNRFIPFIDTERFPGNKLVQVVFRNGSLLRDRPPPKEPKQELGMGYESDEEVKDCPQLLRLNSTNVMKDGDCHFAARALPTTSEKVDANRAIERCPYVEEQLKRKPRTESQRRKRKATPMDHLLSGILILVVFLLISGVVTAFCVMNAKKLNLCKTGSRKRREKEAAAAELAAEKAAKEAAVMAAAAAALNNSTGQGTVDGRPGNSMAWHPIYGRFGGMMPTSMGGAFGTFAVSQPMMNMPNYRAGGGMDGGTPG